MGLVYLPTWMVDFYGKCSQIYHTWILWVFPRWDMLVPWSVRISLRHCQPSKRPWTSRRALQAVSTRVLRIFCAGPKASKSCSWWWWMLGIVLVLLSGKLTWNPTIEVWKMIFLFNLTFSFHANVQGCNLGIPPTGKTHRLNPQIWPPQNQQFDDP